MLMCRSTTGKNTMKGEHMVVVFYLMTVNLFNIANSERVTDICRIFPNNTIIRDPDSCKKYITCIDFTSHFTECKGSTPFFDKDTQKCVQSLSDESICFGFCEYSVGRFIADKKSCYGYYYCNTDGSMQYGLCPDDTHFSETRQTCTQLFNSDCSVDDFDYCSIVKNGINFNDERRCDFFFSCSKGDLVSWKCKDKYYNAKTGTCVAKSQIKCSEHPVPDEVCGTSKKPKNNVFVADEATCGGYFFCAQQNDGLPDLNPRRGKCPIDTFFDSKTQTCKDPLNVKCIHDRCEGRSLTFVNSGTIGCRNYLRCVDGITKDEKTCGNMFFDERRGSCVADIVKLTACN